MTKAETVCELFKLLRVQWRTRTEVARDLGMSASTAANWVDELAANGMLLERQRSGSTVTGPAPAEFCLSPEWGGAAS